MGGAFKMALSQCAWKILTFSLIIQPNYIADVFELRQLVDLYAATTNRADNFFLVTKYNKTEYCLF